MIYVFPNHLYLFDDDVNFFIPYSLPSPGPGAPMMMGQGFPPGARPPAGFPQQMNHPGGPRPPFVQPNMMPHGVRLPDGQGGRFIRPSDGMEGVEGMGPRMPQPMTMADGRPHPMFQQMQGRGEYHLKL